MGVGSGGQVGGQGGCERRIEVFVKIQKQLVGGGWVGGGGGGRVLRGLGGCERRIEIFEKILKKQFGGDCSCWEGQGGCERRIEVFTKIQKKKLGGGSGGLGRGVWLGGSLWI